MAFLKNVDLHIDIHDDILLIDLPRERDRNFGEI